MIMPGSRVKVFDNRLFKNDVDTPLSVTMKEATVIQRYGSLAIHYPSGTLGPYPDLIDVRFDHRPETISKGHFTDFAKELPEKAV